MSYKTLNQLQNYNDIGQALQILIKDNIDLIETSFLAKICRIEDNKVSIMPILKKNEKDVSVIVNNCLVSFPFSGVWQMQYKMKIDDIGLAIVLKNDINIYKKTGQAGLFQTGLFHDKNNSIFIPISLFNTLNNNDVNFILKSSDDINKLEFNNSNLGTLQAQNITINSKSNLGKINIKEDGLIELHSSLLTLKSETTSLKQKLNEIATILDNAMIIQSPSGIQPFDSNTKASINSWKSSLDELFKE